LVIYQATFVLTDCSIYEWPRWSIELHFLIFVLVAQILARYFEKKIQIKTVPQLPEPHDKNKWHVLPAYKKMPTFHGSGVVLAT